MYTRKVMPNGLRVLIIPIPWVKSVTLAFYTGVGSRYESEEQAGISHYIEHMLFKGSAQRPNSRLISEAIEGIGGLNNAFTDREMTGYYAMVAANHFEEVFDVLADMIRHPLFANEELEKERRVIFEELSMIYDQPDAWAGVLLSRVLYGDHPLGHDILGSRESLSAIDRAKMLNFFSMAYHPANMALVVSGAVDEKRVLDKCGQWFGDWPAGEIPPWLRVNGSQPAQRWLIEDRPVEQANIFVALPGLSSGDPQRYAYGLLNAVLGDGMSSRLFLRIREELGLVYAVSSHSDMLRDAGNLEIYLGTDPQNAPRAVQALFEEIDRLCQEPISPVELNKSREFVKGRLILALENSSSFASFYGQQEMLVGEILTLDDILARYDAVTGDELLALARRFWSRDAARLAAVGPFGDGQGLLEGFIR